MCRSGPETCTDRLVFFHIHAFKLFGTQKPPARAKCPLIKYAIKIEIRDCLISLCEEVLSCAHFGTYKSSVGEH